MGDTPYITFGPFTIDRAALELRRDGVHVDLAPMGVALLLALFDRAGELVTREDLYRVLWPEGGVDVDRGLNTLVRQVRMALGDSATSPTYLRTYPKRGYRFELPIESTPPEPVTPAVDPMDHVEAVSAPARFRRTWAIGVAMLTCLLLGMVFWERGPSGATDPALVPGSPELEMAVYMLRRPLAPDVAGAIAQLRKAPSSPTVQALFVQAFVLAGQGDSAAAHAALLPVDDQVDPEVDFARALLAMTRDHDWTRATALTARAVAQRPDDPRYLTQQAFLAALLRDSAKAGTAVRTVLDLRPRTAYLVADVGYIALLVGDRDVARTACERARAMEPTMSSAMGCLASLALLEGDTARALQFLPGDESSTADCPDRSRTPGGCLAALASARASAAARRLAEGEWTYRDLRWAIMGGKVDGLARPVSALLAAGDMGVLTLGVDPSTASVIDDPDVASVLRRVGLLSP